MESLIVMDCEKRNFMKEQSRKIAMKYSSEAMALSYMNIYNELT